MTPFRTLQQGQKDTQRVNKQVRTLNFTPRKKIHILEPVKCPLAKEVGPFFPLLTGGENIYGKQRDSTVEKKTSVASEFIKDLSHSR